MSDLAQRSEKALAPGGALAEEISGFNSRPQQTAMAARVAHAMAAGEDLVAEAATGVGKTFAYLVPAALSGRRVVVSTATRHLQDRIFDRDLPTTLRALGVPADIALLKGRANYLCREWLDQRAKQGELHEDALPLAEISEWAARTRTGDIAEFTGLDDGSPLWRELTSTTETCIGKTCPQFDNCFVERARRRAARADIVVVNHYLLLADMMISEEGFSALLPKVDTVIVDEAHQFARICDRFFGTELSRNRILGILRDLQKDQAARESAALPGLIVNLKEAVAALGKALAALPEKETIAVACKDAAFEEARAGAQAAIAALGAALDAAGEPSELAASCRRRLAAVDADFARVLGDDRDQVAWYERGKIGFRFCAAPIEIAPQLSEKRGVYEANWIYTSATLSVDGRFDHFLTELGIACDCEIYDSPFDYARQAALYLPQRMPHPNGPNYTARFAEACRPLLELNAGRALLLLNSYRALNEVCQLLAPEFGARLMRQGETPDAALIERFRQHNRGVLAATMGFWSGVDMRGAQLHVVAINRLPFAPPGDPLIQGRQARMTENGGNFFVECALPEAVVTLRQGVGRLIRDEGDRGVVMIGDPRLRTQPYGKIFLNSLPPMRRVAHRDELRPYLRAEAAGSGVREGAPEDAYEGVHEDAPQDMPEDMHDLADL